MPRKLVCVDLQDMEPIPGAQFVCGDFTEADVQARIRYALGGQEADVVLSDMSPDTMGDKVVNHSRIMDLAEEAMMFARSVLRNGGVFVCKVFNGASEKNFRESLRQDFVKVKAVKPEASKKTSPEIYYVATGFVPEHLRGASAHQSADSTGIDIGDVDKLIQELESLKRTSTKKS
jgi:23S rRNA (uridine2552-2'-O)-methyltransferase